MQIDSKPTSDPRAGAVIPISNEGHQRIGGLEFGRGNRGRTQDLISLEAVLPLASTLTENASRSQRRIMAFRRIMSFEQRRTRVPVELRRCAELFAARTGV